MATRWNKAMFALVAAALVGFFYTPDAEARGMIVINTGEDVFETGDLPEDFEDIDELKNAKAGYKCQIFGVFWAYFHKWDCTPVAFDASTDTFWDDSDLVDALEEEYSESDIKMPFWKGYGRFVLGAGLLGLVGFGVLRRKKST